ncbi:hypothetical protein HPT25_26285 [Bacillus sp. BRMEA1]|nr:hypothetical protein [Neobacillus endophyticus]NRD80840.1 hypothetical protein [Neobacillus endophyticus]
MNKTITTFLAIAITSIAIATFLFGQAYSMVTSESQVYSTQINNVRVTP